MERCKTAVSQGVPESVPSSRIVRCGDYKPRKGGQIDTPSITKLTGLFEGSFQT